MRGDITGGFGTGVIAGAAATLVLFAYRVATGVPMPAEALAERLIRLLPFPVFAWLLERLQHWAKPLGFAAAVALTLVGFGAGGVVYAGLRQRVRLGLMLGLITGAVTWILSVLLFLPLIQGGLLGERLTTVVSAPALPLAVASLVYGLLLASLSSSSDRAAVPPGEEIRRVRAGGNDPGGAVSGVIASIGRRAVLRRSVLSLCVIAAVSRLDVLAETAATRAGGVVSRAGRLIRGMPPEVTPNGEFYQVSKNYPFDPSVDVRKWSLEVRGLVDRPLRLSFAEFVGAAPSLERYHTLMCISNEVGGDLIGNARWKGIRVRDILALAGVRPDATTIIWRSVDGYFESVPRSVAMDPDSLLAYEMNGAPLPRPHGAPVRVLLPNRYGMKQPKWLTAIEAVGPDYPGYWERQGLSKPAIVKTASAFRAEARHGAAVAVGGWAFAGRRGIAAVEVSADRGTTWFRATVEPALGENCWQLWSAEWTPPQPGEYVLTVRAVDATGGKQAGRRQRLPDGAEGYHEIRVRVGG